MLDYKKINVGIMDLGMNNIFSISQLFKNLGCKTEIYKKKNKSKYHLVVIPGVGSYNQGMKSLVEKKYKDDIFEFYKKKKNIILCICLGMHLLCRSSEEGVLPGLNLVNADVKKFYFSDSKNIKIPHMGWNIVKSVKPNPLILSTKEEQRFYFVHSYKVVPDNSSRSEEQTSDSSH
jgi:glutamine amidotransferase